MRVQKVKCGERSWSQFLNSLDCCGTFARCAPWFAANVPKRRDVKKIDFKNMRSSLFCSQTLVYLSASAKMLVQLISVKCVNYTSTEGTYTWKSPGPDGLESHVLKSLSGGLCLCVVVRETLRTPDLELMSVSLWPICLPREFILYAYICSPKS